MKRLFISIITILFISFASAEEPYIKIGDYNESVIALHNKLHNLGLFSLRPESPFSERSSNALKTLQYKMGLDPTGGVKDLDEYNAIISDNTEWILYENVLINAFAPQIGKSNYEEGMWRKASGGSGIREVVPVELLISDSKSGFHITGDANEVKNTDVAIDKVPVEFGKDYILSCYAKGSGKLHIQHGKDPYPRMTFNLTPDWQLYYVLFTVGDNDGSTEEDPSTSIYFGVPGKTESDVYVCGMTLRKQ